VFHIVETNATDDRHVTRLKTIVTIGYLLNILQEGLRFSTPVRSRLPRVTPESGLTYGKHFIPSGTFISSSPYLMNYKETVFPDPCTYKPERWLLDSPAEIKQLDNCWASFSKGSRGCIGINLAMAEIYITIAAIVRRFELAEKKFEELKIREIFGVIFDEPLVMKLKSVQE
jgi:cytochrome P450